MDFHKDSLVFLFFLWPFDRKKQLCARRQKVDRVWESMRVTALSHIALLFALRWMYNGCCRSSSAVTCRPYIRRICGYSSNALQPWSSCLMQSRNFEGVCVCVCVCDQTLHLYIGRVRLVGNPLQQPSLINGRYTVHMAWVNSYFTALLTNNGCFINSSLHNSLLSRCNRWLYESKGSVNALWSAPSFGKSQITIS